MSRNENRISNNRTPSPIPNQPSTSEDPTSSEFSFDFVSPTEIIPLPSKGMFYEQNHPLYNQESVEIKHPTTKQEDILSSRTLIKKGIAIERLIESLLVDKKINTTSLLVGDRAAILINMRILGYGADYEPKVTCPKCDESVEFECNLANYSSTFPTEEILEKYSVTLTEDNTFLVELPVLKVVVEVRLMNGKDENSLLRVNKKKRKNKIGETSLTDQFKTFIVSVNSHAESVAINHIIENMPMFDSQYLRKVYNQINPGIFLTQSFECPICGHESDMEVPITADFFYPTQTK